MLPRRPFCSRLLITAFALCGAASLAGDAASDWEQILALDFGPQAQPRNHAESRAAAVGHLAKQEKALRSFIAEHPSDTHAFEARLRLARLLYLRGDVEGSEKAVAEGARLLDALQKVATPEQRAEVDFVRVSQRMRTTRRPTAAQREQLLAAARAFQRDHPADRRVALLLAEVAVAFENDPKTMRALLLDAQSLATTAELRSRVADDLKRLDLVGRPVLIRTTKLDGKPFDLEQYRGSVVVLAFFAVWSSPSTGALEMLHQELRPMREQGVRLVAVSLDTKPEPVTEMLQAKRLDVDVAYDGQGWESSVIRKLGINTVPTVWLLDKQGRLRSLNAIEGASTQARQLLHER